MLVDSTHTPQRYPANTAHSSYHTPPDAVDLLPSIPVQNVCVGQREVCVEWTAVKWGQGGLTMWFRSGWGGGGGWGGCVAYLTNRPHYPQLVTIFHLLHRHKASSGSGPLPTLPLAQRVDLNRLVTTAIWSKSQWFTFVHKVVPVIYLSALC